MLTEPIEVVLVMDHIVTLRGTTGVSPGCMVQRSNSREMPVKCDGLAPMEPIMTNDIIGST